MRGDWFKEAQEYNAIDRAAQAAAEKAIAEQESRSLAKADDFAEALLQWATPCTSDYEEAARWLRLRGKLKPCPPGPCSHYGECREP